MRIMRSRQPALPASPHPLMRVAAATSASAEATTARPSVEQLEWCSHCHRRQQQRHRRNRQFGRCKSDTVLRRQCEVRTLVSVWRLRRKQGTRHSRPHHHSRSTQSNCDSNSHFVPPRVVTALRTEGVCLAPRPAPQRTQLRCGPAQAQHSLRQPKGLPSGILAALLLDLGPPANAVALRLLSLTPGRHGQRW